METPGKNHREPNKCIRNFAQAYNVLYGLGKIQRGVWVSVNEVQARRIADAYEALPIHDGTNPDACAAYEQLGQEIERQWVYSIENARLVLEPWTRAGQPYKNSIEMFADVRERSHLYFFRGGEPHPFLGRTDPLSGLSLNDKFRAIHDLYGHAAEGYGFGPRGEENAWIKHSQMFSTIAQRALTTETRGQNCWVNFGRHNYDSSGKHTNLPLASRPYAAQKAALLPDEFADFSDALPHSAESSNSVRETKPTWARTESLWIY